MTSILEIQYLTDNGRVRTVQAFKTRYVKVSGTGSDNNTFTVYPQTEYLEFEGPSGTGYIEKSKILTISQKLDKKEMMK